MPALQAFTVFLHPRPKAGALGYPIQALRASRIGLLLMTTGKDALVSPVRSSRNAPWSRNQTRYPVPCGDQTPRTAPVPAGFVFSPTTNTLCYGEQMVNIKQPSPGGPKGRGAAGNPPNRFEKLSLELDEEDRDESPERVQTQFLRDPSRSIVSRNNSPDVFFDVSVNPYRGCEHGCPYCYARPSHEYLSLSAGLDFETKILVKENAPDLLRREILSPTWVPQPLALSGVTDPYQPVERKLEITRRCLRVLSEYRNPVLIVTKNHLVTRDADLLSEMAQWNGVSVNISITTLDPKLQRAMEPRASSPERRLAAIECLARAGVPVRVLVAPVIPALTDHEAPAILEAAAKAGALYAGYVLLRLPHGVKEIFESWLTRHFPDKRNRVLNRVRETRGGQLNDPRFISRMRGEGEYAEQIRRLFAIARRRKGLDATPPPLCTSLFRRAHDNGQMTLFDR